MTLLTLIRAIFATAIFIVIWVFLHPHVNEIFSKPFSYVYKEGIDGRLPAWSVLGATYVLYVFEYIVMSIASGLVPTLAMVALKERNKLISSLFIAVLVVTAAFITEVWVLYIPPSVNVALGGLVLIMVISSAIYGLMSSWLVVKKRLTST